MEDEQGAVGSNNQVQECYEEIMVEVVGSDVYVDGVSAPKGGQFENGKIGDLEGEGSEIHNRCEGEGEKVKESDLGLLDSRDEKNFVVTEEVDGSFSKSLDVNVEENKAASCDHFSSQGDGPVEEVAGSLSVVVGEEKRSEDESVAKGSGELVTSETLNRPAEGVLDEKGDLEEKKEVTGSSAMVISDEKKTESVAAGKDSGDLVTLRPLNHSAEAVSHEKADLAEKKEELRVYDNSATEEVMGSSPMLISEEKRTENEAVSKDSGDLVTLGSLNHSAEGASHEKVDLAEKEEELPATDNSATEEVMGSSSMLISGEEQTKSEAVGKDSGDLVILGSLDHPAEAVLHEKVYLAEKQEELPIEEVMGSSPIVISEEKRTENEAVCKDSGDLVTRGSLNHSAEAVSHEKTDLAEENEELPAIDNSASCDHFSSAVSVSTEEVTGPSSVVISEEKKTENEAVSKDSGALVTLGPLNHSAEAVSLEKAYLAEKKEELCTIDNSAVTVSTEEASGPSPMVISEEKKTENEEVTEDGADLMTTKPLDHSAEAVFDEKADIAEKKELLPSEEASVSSPMVISEEKRNEDEAVTKDGNDLFTPETLDHHVEAGDNEEAHIEDKKEVLYSSNDHFDADSVMSLGQTKAEKCGLEPAEVTLYPNSECTQNVKVHEIDTVVEEVHLVHKDGSFGAKDERETTDGDGGIDGKSVDGKENFAVENKDSFLENIQDENQVQIDDVPHAIGNDECLKNDGDLETHKAHENQFLSNETNRLIDGGVVEKEECLNVEIQDDEVKNEQNIKSNQPVVGATLGAEMDGQDSAISQAVDGGGSSEKGMEINPEIPLLDDDSAENMHIQEEGALEKVDSSNEVYESIEEEKESDERESEGSSGEKVKCVTSWRMEQSGYLAPPENEGNFVHSDLVWGKVRSHPWWPGQIFDPSFASEKALKYHKKDSYLIAYFGDQTFAWNDSSALRPFRPNFSHIEKQSSSESFHNAVNCALEEVKRRVELALSCSCTPIDIYAKIETQVVENTGIREEASRRHGVDQSTRALHFEPDKLLEYVTGLASRASSRADRLDLVIARAQLSAFCQFRGYRSLTEFPLPGELLESDVEREYSPDGEDEFVDEDVGKSVSLSSGKKRKAVDPPTEGPDKPVTVASQGQTPKPSFKIGECIRRVASQLTGATSAVKGGNDETVINGSNIYEQSEKQSVVSSSESLSVNEMLLQLEILAKDPKKRQRIIQKNIHAFFMGFRSSIVLNRRGRKKKSEGEEFEFDDVNDSYWTDMIVQNEQLLDNGEKDLQLVVFDDQKPVKTGRKSHSRKRFSTGMSPSEEDESAKRRKQESSPAELVLNFAERKSVPSEINLNKMFRRFGPLMESETEVDHESGWAKVIFKRGSDAEVARNSAEKFNVFGPVIVDYQIGYSPVISVKVLPVAIPHHQEDSTVML